MDHLQAEVSSLYARFIFSFHVFFSETETELVVDQSGDTNSTYQSFLDSLPQQDIRWALMDFQFRTARGPSSKVFISIFVSFVANARSKLATVHKLGARYNRKTNTKRISPS